MLSRFLNVVIFVSLLFLTEEMYHVYITIGGLEVKTGT